MTARHTAGAFALASGAAYAAYLLPFDGRDAAITAWNFLIIPTAIYLGAQLASRGPIIAATSTAASIAASLLWAVSYESPAIEPWWIGLAAMWWLGLGWLLRRQHRALGRFTLLLCAATMIDFVLTAVQAPMPIYALGGFKIPLTIAWSFWVGLTLVRDPRWGAQPASRAHLTRWSGATALVGGLLWSLSAGGWIFSHGSTESPRGSTFLGLGAHEFTRLLAVPAALWALSLMSNPARTVVRSGIALGLFGAALVALGALLQTSVVDPDLHFGHPVVQGGWLLFLLGLFPALAAGMVILGLASSRDAPAVRSVTILIGLLVPLPIVAFFLSGVSDGGGGWDIALAIMHAAPGLGWMALGYALLSARRAGEELPSRERRR